MKIALSQTYKTLIEKNYKEIKTLEEEKELILRSREGDQEATDRLVFSQIKLIILLGRDFIKKDTVPDELISCGVTGIINAIKTFDVDRGFRFATHALWQIKNELSQYTHGDALIHIPLNVINLAKQQKKQIKAGLKNENDLDVIEHNLVSLDAVMNDDEHNLNAAFKLDNNIEENRVMKKIIDSYLNCVNGDKRKIIEILYGLNGEDRIIEEEVGKRFGITKQRVSQIKKEFIALIREKFNIEVREGK